MQPMWCNLCGATYGVQSMWCNLCGAIHFLTRHGEHTPLLQQTSHPPTRNLVGKAPSGLVRSHPAKLESKSTHAPRPGGTLNDRQHLIFGSALANQKYKSSNLKADRLGACGASPGRDSK